MYYRRLCDDMLDLNNVSTSDLVEALRYRKGVSFEWVQPDQTITRTVDGPSILLVVVD